MRRRLGRLGVLLAVLLVATGGCSGDETSNDQIVKGTISSAVISVPVSINGATAKSFVLDTGAPLTLVDPARFPATGVPAGAGHVATLDVGGVHLTNVAVVGASPCGLAMCTDSDTAGLLGGDVLINYEVTIDYQAVTVGFDASALPVGLGAPVSTTFGLEGGGRLAIPGTNDSVTVPATRIAVDVGIEGTIRPFVLDTGSSQMVLRPDLYDQIVADGRAQGSTKVSTVTGTSSQPTTQLTSVSLAGVTQTNVGAVRSPLNLDVLSAEVGHTVDGLLGGSYLAHYVITIDYPARQITLRSMP